MTEPQRHRRRLPAFALVAAGLCAACSHGQRAARLALTEETPLPDEDAMREVTAQAPSRYVSSLAYRHYVAALLAKSHDALPLAAAELREALLFDPESTHLHAFYAETLLRLGRLAQADEQIKLSLALDPGHGPSRLLAAQMAQAAHRGDEARAHLQAALRADADDAEVWRELVRLEVARGLLDQAHADAGSLAAAAHRALDLAAASRREDAGVLGRDRRDADWQARRAQLMAAEAFVEVARARASQRDDTAAAAEFARAAELAPSEEPVLAARAAFLESRRRVAEARALQLRILLRRPDAPEALAALGRLAMQGGDPEAARAYADKLRALAGELLAEGHGREDDRRELAQAIFRLGIPLLGAHRGRESLALFETALQLMPGNSALSFYRAVALARTGRAADAASLFESLAEGPSRVGTGFLEVDRGALLLDAQVQAALARSRAGQLDEALARLRSLFARNPTEEAVGIALLEAHERAGRVPAAVALLAGAVERNPRSPAALFALGTAQERKGDRSAAYVTMHRLLALDPQHAGALNYVGYSLCVTGSPGALEEAEPLLRRATALRPDDGAIADSLGFCLLRLGQVEDALSQLQRADQLSPDDPVILGHLGDAFLAVGRKGDAEAAFRRALHDLPTRAAKGLSEPTRSEVPRLTSEPREGREGGDERLPDPADAHVRDELEAKLRSLTAR